LGDGLVDSLRDFLKTLPYLITLKHGFLTAMLLKIHTTESQFLVDCWIFGYHEEHISGSLIDAIV
jgi:hypothetical protein